MEKILGDEGANSIPNIFENVLLWNSYIVIFMLRKHITQRIAI
jgi:hypothetical protein